MITHTKYILFLATILSISSKAVSQQNETSEYYQNIHTATLYLCKDSLTSSKMYFSNAFEKLIYPFFIDINNALFTNIYSDNIDSTIILSYLSLLQKKGICIHTYYDSFSILNPFLNKLPHEKCSYILDTQKKEKIDKLIASDQILRNFSYEQYGEVYNENIITAIEKIDSSNFYIVHNLLQEALAKNVSLENWVGLEALHDIFIILLHNVNWARYDREIIDTLVQKGLLDNRIAEKYSDYFCNLTNETLKEGWDKCYKCHPFYGLFGRGVIRFYQDYVYIFSPNQNEYNVIDSLRKLYFLPNLFEEAKERWYMLDRKNFGYIYTTEMINPEQERNYTIEMMQKGFFKITEYRRHDKIVF